MATMYPNIPTVLKDGVKLISYAHEGDAGLDLCANEDVTLRPGEWKMVGSGASMAIPDGFVGLVVPRSGRGSKGLVLKNTLGVIDAPYRGEVMLPLFNNNQKTGMLVVRVIRTALGKVLCDRRMEPEGTIHVHKGDRVAQLLIVPVAKVTPVQADTLDETERGDGSFGSTDRQYERL